MFKTARETADAIEVFLPLVKGCEVNLWLAPPFISIATAVLGAKGSRLVIGAQNMHEAREGAFTGEISSLMLKEAGASFVLLGHSERRHLFKETNGDIHKKLLRALQDDLIPVLCVGETLAEREEGKTVEILEEQLVSALDGVPKEDEEKIIFAYEPVWAIGTGKSATPAIAQEAHALIRSFLRKISGKKKGTNPILYGGSVRPENVGLLLAEVDIDGVLVGGASLDPQIFASIVLHSLEKKL